MTDSSIEAAAPPSIDPVQVVIEIIRKIRSEGGTPTSRKIQKIYGKSFTTVLPLIKKANEILDAEMPEIQQKEDTVNAIQALALKIHDQAAESARRVPSQMVREAQEQRDEARSELETILLRMERIEAERDHAQQQLRDREAEHQRYLNVLQDQMATERAGLTAQIAAAQANAEKYRQLAEEHLDLASGRASDIAKLKGELETTGALLAEVRKAKAEVNQQMANLVQQHQELSGKLEAEVTAHAATARFLDQRTDEKKSALAKADELKTQINEMKAQAASVPDIVGALKSALAPLEQRLERIESAGMPAPSKS